MHEVRDPAMVAPSPMNNGYFQTSKLTRSNEHSSSRAPSTGRKYMVTSSSHSPLIHEGGALSGADTQPSKQRKKWNIFKNLNGLGVFDSTHGMKAQMTPVSKKFAPSYASAHSLVANTICFNTANSIRKQKSTLFKKVAPKKDQEMKVVSSVVDSQLTKVVEAINDKKQQEKEQRDLKTKLVKRHDEIRSLAY